MLDSDHCRANDALVNYPEAIWYGMATLLGRLRLVVAASGYEKGHSYLLRFNVFSYLTKYDVTHNYFRGICKFVS